MMMMMLRRRRRIVLYICNTHSIRRYRHFPLLYIVKWKNVKYYCSYLLLK